MINNYHLKVERTARYSTYGTLSEKTEHVWWVCHGYGQLARYFLKKFEVLNPEKHFVIAPEALSHFYLEGYQRVGASWITKENRLSEIEDYLNYLNQVHKQITEADNFPVNADSLVLGFSQGVATAVRWVYDQKINCDHLVMWAGGFPFDVDFTRTKSVLGNSSLSFIRGSQDRIFTSNQFETEQQKMKDEKISPKILTYEGKHELNGEILQSLTK